jgi:hypothetical protein
MLHEKNMRDLVLLSDTGAYAHKVVVNAIALSSSVVRSAGSATVFNKPWHNHQSLSTQHSAVGLKS